MKKFVWNVIPSFVLFFVSLSFMAGQTMTFNSCACETGFSFSGWSWYSAGGDGRIYVSEPNVNFTATITKNDLCFDVVSFDKILFNGTSGGGTWKVWDNTGREKFFTIGGGGTETLNWTKVKWLKFKLEDPGTGNPNNTWDFDNLVYTVPAPVPAVVSGFSASSTEICPGTSVTLSVSGNLNDATEWKLYSGSCGGTLLGSTAGNSFTVSPGQTTTYYVRGEGICTTPGACAAVTVSLNTNSTALTSASANPSEVCPGDLVSLSASGGTVGTGSSIFWYTGPSGTGTQVGSGSPLSIAVTDSQTFYARREGTCNNTSDISVSVVVRECDPCANAGGDTDADGVCDNDDGCPNDPNKTAPGACGCGELDTDSDGDGTPDCNDECPDDPGKIAPGICGCGTPDVDTDGDGTADCVDGCPSDPNKTDPGICGCGVSDVDTDGDGTEDCIDGCPTDADKVAPGICGCGTPETDTDGDTIPDCVDPDDDNDGQTDVDELACGSDPLDPVDTSPDNDSDTSPDCVDPDDDNDGIVDVNDNCPFIPNPLQEDLDADAIGDVCDPVVNIDGAVMNAVDEIITLDLPIGLENALIGKLDKALEWYCSGKQNQALNKLNAFINQVSDQRGDQIPSEVADYLIAQAQAIIDAILNGTVDCPEENEGMSAFEGNLGIANNNAPEIRIFPNPATNEVWLEIPGETPGHVQVNLLDLKGAVMEAIKIEEGVKGPLKIQLGQYQPGLYLVQIIQPGNLLQTLRLVVE